MYTSVNVCLMYCVVFYKVSSVFDEKLANLFPDDCRNRLLFETKTSEGSKVAFKNLL